MSTRIGVITFPGSLDDTDAARAVEAAGAEPVKLWHAERNLRDVDAVILPGGFSYGDYLRCGAIARFSPMMEAVVEKAAEGLPVLGICNGFQILCEAQLLPGVLTRNAHRHFRCRDQWLAIENASTAWTSDYSKDQKILVPLKSGEGLFAADDATLDALEANGQIVARYVGENPNGAMRNIAGITNKEGNIVGLMPHPEHAIDTLYGPSVDGLGFFTSAVHSILKGDKTA